MFVNRKDRKRPLWRGKQVKKQKLESIERLGMARWEGGREENVGILGVCWGPGALPPGQGAGLVPAGGRLAKAPLELCSDR